MEPFVAQRSTLPFWGEKPKFQEWFQNFEVAASKFRGQFSFDLNDLERPKWELKKMSWDCPVFPIDAKNSIGFLVQFFLSYAPLVGDSVKGSYWILRIELMASCQKVPKFYFQRQFSMLKIIRIFLIFSSEEYQFRSTFFDSINF